jgi:hypothetical protein
MTEALQPCKHVGALLSGYIDGELTQQDRQRVRLHLDSCKPCEAERDEILSLREQLGKARLSDRDHDIWREAMDNTTVKATRGIGWLLLIGGVLLGVGIGVFEIVTEPSAASMAEKLIVGGIYGGMLLIFISVLRQRLIERKTDKYKDVEI